MFTPYFSSVQQQKFTPFPSCWAVLLLVLLLLRRIASPRTWTRRRWRPLHTILLVQYDTTIGSRTTSTTLPRDLHSTIFVIYKETSKANPLSAFRTIYLTWVNFLDNFVDISIRSITSRSAICHRQSGSRSSCTRT